MTRQRALLYGLCAAMLLRVALNALFMTDVLPLAFREGWALYRGGDEQWFLELAQSLARGQPQASPVGIGLALIMTPFVAVTRAQTLVEIAQPLVIVHGFIMGPLSVAVVGLIAYNLRREPLPAVGAAALWAIVPLLGYLGFFWHHEPVTMRSTTVPRVAWLNALSDGPALFFVLVGVLLLSVGTHRTPMPWRFWALLSGGAAFGLALMFRIHTIPFLLAVLLLTAFTRGWRGIAIAGSGVFVGYSPQMWYHQLVFGRPVAVGYIAYPQLNNAGRYGFEGAPCRSIVQLAQEIGGYLPERSLLLVVVGGVAILVTGLAYRWLAGRHTWQGAYLLLIVPLAYLLPLMATQPFYTDPIRFSMPVMPFAIITGIVVIADILRAGRTKQPALSGEVSS